MEIDRRLNTYRKKGYVTGQTPLGRQYPIAIAQCAHYPQRYLMKAAVNSVLQLTIFLQGSRGHRRSATYHGRSSRIRWARRQSESS